MFYEVINYCLKRHCVAEADREEVSISKRKSKYYGNGNNNNNNSGAEVATAVLQQRNKTAILHFDF